MTRYIWLIALPGGCLLFALVWLARRAQTDQTIDTLIKRVRQVFTGHDDALRVRTDARRKAADAIRTRASRVESGEKLGSLIRMAGRND